MEPGYETLREVARGARFSVFRAHRAGQADVVLKRARSDRPELRSGERLRHEYDVLRFLGASGAPRALDFTTIEGDPVLVVEDAGAHNLAETLGHRPLGVDAFLDLAIEMARAVGEAHGHSVIHRDICPENFVVDEAQGRVTLVDFESATVVPAFSGLPGLPGELEGTLAYLAPEQTGRMKRLVDRRADLYALGATFYEMLTGEPPFAAGDPLELVHAHAARAPYAPAMIEPGVPPLLSGIVMKLLEKMPESRYQSAEALVADLEEARRQRRKTGRIAEFELGRGDVPYGFPLWSARLFGREQEASMLEQAFVRVRAGAPEVLVVSGSAGTGKSALVNELCERAASVGRWIVARGDLLRSNVPYAPLIEAFSALARALSEESGLDLDGLRERVQAAIVPNGGVLTDVAPELRTLLGDPPPAAPVGALERENRLQLVFAAFVRALVAELPSLVLFIDDLQWLDPASLKLMRAIAVAPGPHALLTLCACRSDALERGHPVREALDSIAAAGARVTRVELNPLDSEAVLALLSDSLRARPAEVTALAAIIQRKTGGNPFFVRQFLGYLYRGRLLAFDAERARWTWDLGRIEQMEISPRVADLLSSVIATLPADSCRALEMAACVGNRFELDLLAHLLDEPPEEAARALWAPVQAGLLVAVPEGPRFRWMIDKPVELGAAATPAFRFAHPHIQEAAYRRLSEAAQRRLHCRIGHWLEAHVPEEDFEGALGAIVDQLDRCADQLPELERVRLASLNARTGRQAHSRGALESALRYFQYGLDLLPREPWNGESHELWFGLLRDAAECAGLLGDLPLSEHMVSEGIGRTRAILERVALYSVGVRTNAFHGAHTRAIQLGRAGLALLGLDLPQNPSSEQVSLARKKAEDKLRTLSDSELLAAPPLQDATERAKLQLLIELSSTWFLPSRLFQIVACDAAELTASRGVAPGSAVAYAMYAMTSVLERDCEEGDRYGRLSVGLAERLASPTETCRVLLGVGGHVTPWRAPFSEAVPLLERSYSLALDSGDLEFAAYALSSLVFIPMAAGAELNQVLAKAESALAFYRRVHHLSGLPYVRPFVQAVRCLRGTTRSPFTFDDDEFAEERFRAEAANNGLGQAIFHTLRIQCSYLLGDAELAWKYVTDAKAWLPYLRTLPYQVEFHFYAGLTAVRRAESAEASERARLVGNALGRLALLETWSSNAPLNFRHKRDLLAAELARVEARPSDALRLYRDAIECAGSGGFTQDEALAHELVGRFNRSQNGLRVGDLHLGAALDAYALWGALAKVEQLERDFPSASLRRRVWDVSARAVPPALDHLSLVKASEALTGELSFEPLLVKLVRICGEAAGAARTVLALDEGGLVQRAMGSADGQVSVERRPIAGAAPVSVMDQVFRSKEVVVLGDAAREGPFSTDPYIAEHRVRSVLAVPIARGERVLGVVYFENNLTHDAFTPERADMFRLLSAEMAVALENSRVFEERKRTEATLRVLAETSAKLAETLDYAELLAKLGGVLVPSLADWGVVDVLEDGALRPIAWAHVNPGLAGPIEALRRRYAGDGSSERPQGQVLRSEKALLVPEVTEASLGAGSEDTRAFLRSLDPRSAMFVPLAARGRTIGVVTLVSSSASRRYTSSDLELAEEVVRRIGLALENARLYRDLREALRERSERDRYLRMIFRHLPGAFWAVDRDLRVTYVTGRLLNVVGIEARKLMGITVSEFVGTPDPSEPMVAHHLAALQGQVQAFEYRFRDRWYAMLIEPLLDRDGGIVGCVAAGFDVTERREIADRLVRSEQRLQEAQRVAHVGSFEWEIQPNVLTWSDELQRIYGFEPGEFAGTFEAFIERVPADQVASTRKVIFDAYARLAPFAFDHRIRRTDGRIRMLHSRGDFIQGTDGNPVRMVGTSWDVTEQKQLFAKLEHAVSRWEATVNATAEGILVVDLDGKVVSANQRLRSLWQLPSPIAEGVHHLQLFAPALGRLEDGDAFVRRVEDVYAHKEEEFFDVVRFVDGRVFEWSSIPQRIGDDTPGRVWSFRDVTERERLLRRATFLGDATRLLASLAVEQALDGVAHLAVPYLGEGCAIDLFGDGGPRRLIAVSRDSLRPISSEVHPTALAGNSTLYRVGSLSYLGVPLLMKGRVIGVITLSAGPRRRYSAADLELAEELARRAALAIDNARLYRGAQEALSARDEFLSIAAHEIRGPVHAIHMAVQALRLEKVSTAALPRLLDVIERQDRRLAQFVDELLDLGRSRTGRLQLEYEPVNLGDVVREVVVRVGADAARSGSALTITARTRIVGQWDKSRLDQVVFNLLSNAIKFGLGKPIEITLDSRDATAVLSVKDHGVGIPQDLKERIFRPFERGVSERHYGGLGLGLHIAKTIVDALGGSIRVESEPGAGSTFIVELPVGQLGEKDAHLDS